MRALSYHLQLCPYSAIFARFMRDKENKTPAVVVAAPPTPATARVFI